MTSKGTPLHGAHASIKIGSLIHLLTADHPRGPALHRQGYESGILCGSARTVWIGSDAIILLGVSIGGDAIVGAESVATRNVPAGTTVNANTAKVYGRKG
jgi:maltose O-acetyltransferase